MSEQRGGVGTRLYLAGGTAVEQGFDRIGASGQRMWSQIAAGERTANPALKAVSRTVGEVRSGIDGLVSQVGPAGNVLGAFGAGGIAVAAGLAGIAVAVGQARSALKFADEIGDSAAKVGVSAEALQQYRYAVHQAGGEFRDADDAIGGFTRALGGAESGLSPKLLKAFKELGFNDADLKRMKDDVPSALAEVMQRISKLGSEAERAAVADKLGLTPMLPLLRLGADRMAELADEARKLGFVMDEALIAKASDANDKLEVLSQVIDVQLKSAFVDLAPFIIQATEALADLLKGIAGFLNDPRVKAFASFTGNMILSGGNVALATGMMNEDMARLPADFGMDGDDPDFIRRGIMQGKIGLPGGTSLIRPPGKPAKPKSVGTPIPDDYAISPYDPITGKIIKQLTPQEEAFKSIFGYRPDDAPEAKKKVDVDVELKPSLTSILRAQMKEWQDGVRDTFRSGVQAAFDGNLMDWLKKRLMDGLFNRIADSLASLWTQIANKGQGGSGVGGWLVELGNIVFGGGKPPPGSSPPPARNAVGGYDWTGLNSKAEYGAELGVFGRPGQVFSHDEMQRMLGGTANDRAANINFAPVINAPGADREGLRQVNAKLDALAHAIPDMIDAQSGPAAHQWLQNQHVLPRAI
jgi:hypothetical protein